MREISTEIEIHAPAARVWQILTALSEYPEWNPFVREARGEVREGARLEVRIELVDGSGMKFRPTVLRAEPEREFRWLGRLFLPGLFDGEHVFQLASVGEGRTRLVHREKFRGALVPLLWASMAAKAEAGFEKMNLALKRRAESDSAVEKDPRVEGSDQ